MKIYLGSSVALCLMFTGLGLTGSRTTTAQAQSDGTTPPPKVLQLITEVLKPGKAGSAHEKTESAFVQAFSAAHWPEHYFGMDALSGRGRSVFIIGYDSFADWQKDVEATQKNQTLSAALDSATAADGALLESYEMSTYAYREDLSLRGPVKIEDMRYMEISVYDVRPGHTQDWEALAKLYIDSYQKVAGAHWATFEKIYGTAAGSRFIVASPLKSLAEVDQEMVDDKAFVSTAGPDQLKKLSDLSAVTIESTESNVYMFNPKLSYPPESWVKSDPAFWGQK